MNAFTRHIPRAFIPRTPTPEEVNCYMEVETVCRSKLQYVVKQNFEKVEAWEV